jgi:hypothetical protein
MNQKNPKYNYKIIEILIFSDIIDIRDFHRIRAFPRIRENCG